MYIDSRHELSDGLLRSPVHPQANDEEVLEHLVGDSGKVGLEVALVEVVAILGALEGQHLEMGHLKCWKWRALFRSMPSFL